MADLLTPLAEREVVTVAPGAVWLRRWLSIDEQRAIARRAQALLDGPAGGYVPRVRGGGLMHVRMLCLGRHWNAATYEYEAARSDHDGQPAAPIPEDWIALAARAAEAAGFRLAPDICIVNWYGDVGRMGLHQDKSETSASLEAGLPVVPISVVGSRHVMQKGHLTTYPSRVGLIVHAPIETAGMAGTDRKAFGERVRHIIAPAAESDVARDAVHART